MADPGLRGYLYTEAERAMGNLFEKGCISAAGHAEILRILRMEHGGGQQTGYPVQQSFPMPLQNAYPQQNAYQVQPPKYETASYPAPQVRLLCSALLSSGCITWAVQSELQDIFAELPPTPAATSSAAAAAAA